MSSKTRHSKSSSWNISNPIPDQHADFHLIPSLSLPSLPLLRSYNSLSLFFFSFQLKYNPSSQREPSLDLVEPNFDVILALYWISITVLKSSAAVYVSNQEDTFIKMFPGFCITLVLLSFIAAVCLAAAGKIHTHESNLNSSNALLMGVELPNGPSFNTVSPCTLSTSRQSRASHVHDLHHDEDTARETGKKRTFKLRLQHRSKDKEEKAKKSVMESTVRDVTRIQTLHRRIVEKKNQNTLSRLTKKEQKGTTFPPAPSTESYASTISGHLTATLESGASLGSGEYFMDVFVGTPPKHFSLILDTGSDLNWIQCVPCLDCFEQNGPHYNPQESTSYRNISCRNPQCHLVSSPDPPLPCVSDNQTCPYYYWYGDSSNTTGDFAFESFTVNLTSIDGKSELRRVDNVMFGCGHWNRGLFHGAAGLLGLGRGPLSFSSQLQSLYGHSFSYCLVDRNSDSSVSSKLIFGEDENLMNHPELNFTSLVNGKENAVDTYYYVQVKSILVGEEEVEIPENVWESRAEGVGGTIIDSGTTLSYFAEPSYGIIKEAFLKKVKNYPVVKLKDFPILDPCFNVSGVKELDLPGFAIRFRDGAVWNFPVENYFIMIEPDEVVCLAIMGSPPSALSIIGNYQQQNFHILYDTKNSRLGFAPTNCAEV